MLQAAQPQDRFRSLRRYEQRDAESRKVLSHLRQAVNQAGTIYIATDSDRKSETIGWHLQQTLKLNHLRQLIDSEITP